MSFWDSTGYFHKDVLDFKARNEAARNIFRANETMALEVTARKMTSTSFASKRLNGYVRSKPYTINSVPRVMQSAFANLYDRLMEF